MTNPYRDCLAKLADKIDFTWGDIPADVEDLLCRARALLDQPVAEAPAEALAARPLLEQVAAMADCIGAHTVGQITAISDRAAAWLRENPPGQPVAIEPRGCPTPGACSCVEPTPQPVAVSERLPGPEDCDAEGRCWMFGNIEGDWRLISTINSGIPKLKYCFSHWLPANALPTPLEALDD
jgi:hypothetical protein